MAALVAAALAVPARAQAAGSGVAPGPNSVVGFGGAASVDGSVSNLPGPVVGIAAAPDGNGYWAVSSAGQVTGEGSATGYGSISGLSLNAPVLGMAATPSGGGYWLVAADGGIFSYGNAAFHGSTGGMRLNQPVVGMAPTRDGGGYWLVAADGGIFAFGDAGFFGSTGSIQLNQPIVGMAPTPDGNGYWLVARDGGIFAFGDATFLGSGVGSPATAPAVGIAARPGGGYWLAFGSGAPLSTALGQEELLATLGYLPLNWSPAAGFTWRWAMPASLTSLWSPGQDNIILQGAIRAFEAQVGLPMDGAMTGAEQAALAAAAVNPGPAVNPNGYTYAFATQVLPETMTVWHNGVVIETTLVNTGIPAAPTADGTFPVYSRLASQIMTGINPNGTPYADPVQWVAYFNGGDAVHYIARSSYGYPQSLGCIETPYNAAAFIWPYLTYGTLVTVSG